ncbi:XRE family transcriptional regulator [Nocardia jejuensis]|uniref:XRE family transcriptional regulator n=1 Tax=Nocardia jejuensis TaxID=328049 RepID=UPI000A9BAC3E|nr:XRE family transcriptional regulator [Nocardia jejuensis]
MTQDPQSNRYCTRCGTRLSQYNTETCCGSCETKSREQLESPYRTPPGFWHTDQIRDALATWHMGRVIFAYRTHPFHARPLAQETIATWLSLTQAQLSRIEKGPAPEQLSKLIRWAQILQIPADLLWFRLPPRNVDTLEDVNRQGFLRVATVTVASPAALLDALTAIRPTPIPSIVGIDEIEQIRKAAKVFSSIDASGGGVVREAVLAQVRYAIGLLNTTCDPKYRDSLHSAVGYLTHTAAFMAFDRYEHDDARTMFSLALTCAEAGNDWHLRAKIHSSAARQSIWCKEPDDGLTAVGLAFTRPDRLTATERAMLHTTHARALAKLGRVQETLAAIGRADDEFAHANPSEDPPWMTYYGAAQHSGDTGHALFDLAIHGRFVNEARTRLTTAAQGHSDAYLRSRAISATKLASLIMATSDPVEAAAVGHHALRDASHLRSRRAADDLRELRAFAQSRTDQPHVAELTDTIDELLPLG